MERTQAVRLNGSCLTPLSERTMTLSLFFCSTWGRHLLLACGSAGNWLQASLLLVCWPALHHSTNSDSGDTLPDKDPTCHLHFFKLIHVNTVVAYNIVAFYFSQLQVI